MVFVKVGVVKLAVDANEVPPPDTSYQRYSCKPMAPDALTVTVVLLQPEPLVTVGGEGGEQIVKFDALVTTLQPTVTSIGPVVVPTGTVTVRLVAVEELMVAFTPLIFTVLANGVEKFVPVMVTEVPALPKPGENEVTVGGEISPITFLNTETEFKFVIRSLRPSPSISAMLVPGEDDNGKDIGETKELELIMPELLVFLKMVIALLVEATKSIFPSPSISSANCTP